MKNSQLNDNQEISASKLKINIINQSTKNPSLTNKPQLKRNQNNEDINIQLNNDLNTSNTNDNNIPSISVSLLKQLVNKADKLEIEIINSLLLDSNTKIEINALGMVQGSKRKEKDGITYFGLIDENNSYIDTTSNEDIDYIINANDIGENNNLLGRHFRIRFDINKMKYFIKDLGKGFGTFKKIIEKEKIKDSYLLNIGNSYIVCTFGLDEYYQEGDKIEDDDNILNIKVFSEVPQTEPHFFNPKQFKRIYIGRDISCNIIIDDSLLSRIHCTLEYDDEDGWVIYDGKIDDNENKKSTNGTWLYLIEEIPIENGLIFKNNKNAFECHIIKQKQEN